MERARSYAVANKSDETIVAAARPDDDGWWAWPDLEWAASPTAGTQHSCAKPLSGV